jgi:hypothetical protein
VVWPPAQQPDNVQRRVVIISFLNVMPGGATVGAGVEGVDRLSGLLARASERLLPSRILQATLDEREDDPMDTDVVLGPPRRVFRQVEVVDATAAGDAEVSINCGYGLPYFAERRFSAD